MFVRFLKDWTLPVSISTGILVYFLFAELECLAPASDLLGPVFVGMLPYLLFVILFTTFIKIDFRKVRLRRWHYVIILCQLLFVSVIVGLTRLCGAGGLWLVMSQGVLTCVVGPCAAAAPVVTTKLGGTLEEMTTYVFVSNFVTAAMVPVAFPLMCPGAEVDFFVSFYFILVRVIRIICLPLLAAWFVMTFLGGLHRRLIAVKDLSFYVWASTLTVITGNTMRGVNHCGAGGVVLFVIGLGSLLICMVQFVVGRWLGGHFSDVTRIDAGQALGQKNSAFAVWIAYTYLNPISSIGPGCYIIWQNLVNSLELYLERRRGDAGGV